MVRFGVVKRAFVTFLLVAAACTGTDDGTTPVQTRDAGDAASARDGGPAVRDAGSVRDGGVVVFDAERLATALATHLRECNRELTPAFANHNPQWFDVAYDVDAWTDAMTAYYEWADQSSRVDVDLDRYVACLEGHLMRPTCDDSYRTVAACTSIFVGTQAENRACAQDIECAGDLHCARAFDVECGTCRPLRQLNDACGVERCAAGLTCRNDVCVPFDPPVVKNVGDPCDPTEPNACGTAAQRFGARCLENVCTVPTFSGPGGPCMPGGDEACLDEGYKHRCSTNVAGESGMCELLPGVDDPCRFGNACNLFEARCDEIVGRCVAVSQLGEPCTETRDCSWGLHCGNRRTCQVGPTIPPFCPG